MRRRGRQRQNIGYLVGITFSLIFIFILLLPSQQKWHVKGPMNTGHEELNCQSCHRPAPGTMRQQIQANTRYFLGIRNTPVDFGYQDVSNTVCLECHQRPNDRHPVFRFVEARFAKAREEIQPQFCISCHLEHTGKRVTVERTTYCMHCHEDTKLKNDPITVSHDTLIRANQWETCLGCHDYHGNHVMETETVVQKAYKLEYILDYLAGGPSPYPEATYYQAKEDFSDE